MTKIRNLAAGLAVTAFTALAASGLSGTAHAGFTNPADLTGAVASRVQTVAVDARTQRLFDRQFRPHSGAERSVWTSKLKAASGDPNIVVFDRRFGFSEIFECSYITYRAKRAIVCQ